MLVREDVQRTTERVFWLAILASFLIHLAGTIFVTTVDLPPPPSRDEFTSWVKKIAPPRVAEVVPEAAPKVNVPKVAETEATEGEGKAAPKQAASEKEAPEKEARPGKPGGGGTGKGGGSEKRAALREALGGAGILGAIGAAGGGNGEVADVFSSGKAVSEDVGGALEKGGGKGVGVATGGGKIGRGSGGLGSGSGTATADIGHVGTGGTAGSVKGSGKQEAKSVGALVKGADADILGGGIDRKGVTQAIMRRNSGFRRCYETALKGDQSLRGKVVFEITIDENGRVVEVRIIENGVKNRDVADCVVGILKRLSFPKPTSGMVTVRQSLVFEPTE